MHSAVLRLHNWSRLSTLFFKMARHSSKKISKDTMVFLLAIFFWRKYHRWRQNNSNRKRMKRCFRQFEDFQGHRRLSCVACQLLQKNVHSDLYHACFITRCCDDSFLEYSFVHYRSKDIPGERILLLHLTGSPGESRFIAPQLPIALTLLGGRASLARELAVLAPLNKTVNSEDSPGNCRAKNSLSSKKN